GSTLLPVAFPLLRGFFALPASFLLSALNPAAQQICDLFTFARCAGHRTAAAGPAGFALGAGACVSEAKAMSLPVSWYLSAGAPKLI
ncbi:hypothetical protein Q4485_14170, partial [Granulosicoccaceae sp. 1_MG-2023]|nr:hypothetical protein [Granulosicoccaceae sp. 1_MG-2023]